MRDGLRLLRGRVVVRRAPDVENTILILPDISGETHRKTRIHAGTVLALGPPPRTVKGVEVPWDVRVGDKVYFVYALAMERYRTLGDLAWIHCDELQAIVEPAS